MINFKRTLEVAGNSGFLQPIELVQYDDALPISLFQITENGQAFTIPSGAKAKVRMRKADGKGVYNDAEISGNAVKVVFTQQMTAAYGTGFLNIELTYDGGVKSTEQIQIVVTENAVQQGSIESTDEFLTLEEIIKRVETLRQQTAIDAAAASASKTAAASSATAAQAARQGAEAAESRVNAIVAGNEAWTKQQSNDRFARALKTEAAQAATLEIYPDEGSNIVVTAYGFTEQAGSGDASPANVREIAVAGKTGSTTVNVNGISQQVFTLKLNYPLCDGDTVETYAKSGCDKELVLDGSSDEQWKFESSAKRFTLLISTLGDYPVASSTKIQLCNILNYDSALSTNTAFFVYGSAYGGGTTLFLSSGFAEDLDSLKTKLAENPIKIRYRSTNYEPRKDISVCLEKHKRFYYELNEDADWKLGGGSGTDQYYCVLPFTAKTGNEICSHFKRSTSAATENSFSTSGSIYIRTTSGMFNGVDGFKGYIAEQKTASKHITVECELATPITYAHDPIYLAAYPDGNGKFTVSGEKLVSAKYSKSLNREFEEFKAAMLAMVANLSF